MYPHTIAGLFEAVAKGTLADVEEVVKSKKVDINQHYLGMHIINFAIINKVPPFKEKINILINSGAIPEFNEQCNILLELYDIENKELQNKVLNLIRNNAQFKSIYTQHHFDVINGILPQSEDEAFKTDYFGLYPIHYALIYKNADKSWFEKFKYDLFTPIKSGLYAGTSLIYFVLNSIKYDDRNLFDNLMNILANLSPGQRYQILKAGPLSINYLEYGMTVARLLLVFNRFVAFTRLTQGLSAEQRFELLKSAPLNLDFAPCGITVAWELIDRQRNDDFARLTQGLSAEQRFELLKSVPSHVIHYGYSVTVAALLLFHNRYDDFTRLTQELSAEQRFELLKPALSKVARNFYGQTVAWELLFRERYDDFTRLTQDLSVEQRFELLKSSPTSDLITNGRRGISVAWLLLFEKRYDDFTRLTQGLSVEQRVELLKLAPLHASNKLYGITVLDQLLEQRQFNIFEILVKDLSLKLLFELLSADYKTQPQATSIKNTKLTRFNYLLNVSESLLRKILESYKTDDLVSMYDNLELEHEGHNLISIIIHEKSIKDKSMLNNILKPAESVSDAALQMPPAPSNTNESDDNKLAITEEEALPKDYKNQDSDFSLTKATEVHTMFKLQKTPNSHSPSRNKIEHSTSSIQSRAPK